MKGAVPSARQRLAIRLIALLTALVGLLDLVSAVTPALPDRVEALEGVFPLEVRTGAHLYAAFSSFLLLNLAVNLLRRKRLAWLLTCLLLAGSVVGHLLRGLAVGPSLLSALLLLLLLAMGRSFTARSDPPSIRQGVRLVGLALVFTLTYGSLGFYLLDRHYAIRYDAVAAVRQTLAMFLTETAAGPVPRSRFGAWFADSIATIGALTVGTAVLMLLRPVLLPGGATEAERARARRLVKDHAVTSLACFTLLPDKTLFFSPSGRSLIAYVPRGRGAVALGDPIGPAEDRRAAIEAFCAHCARNDWHPAFYQTLPEHLDLYRSLGFRVLKIGEEGIVDLESFSLRGKAAAALRTPFNKFSRLGYTVEVLPPPVAGELIEDLRPISEEWLHRMQGSEKKFSLGWFDRDYLSGTTIALVRTSGGEIRAFANLITGFRADEVAIDLMRSRKALEPGTMDFLFVSLFLHFQAAGLRRFNLGLSALAGLGEGSGSSRLERTLARLGNHLDRFYGFRGLHDYKNKFHPLWEPRYLIYPSLTALPEVIVALVRADSGDRLIDYLRPG